MQKNVHPEYGPVAFRDRATGHLFLTRSTLVARPGLRTVEIEGVSCPVVDVDTSSDSHPFWTGNSRTLDTEGRVEAFRRRYGRRTDER